MIPTDLQRVLKKEIEVYFNNRIFEDANFKSSNLKIYEQELPEKKYEDDEDINFPFIVIELTSGKIGENSTCDINFIIGTVDLDNTNGFNDVFSILNGLMLLFNKKIFAGKYEILDEMDWATAKDDSGPFHYGSLETKWTVPNILANNYGDLQL